MDILNYTPLLSSYGQFLGAALGNDRKKLITRAAREPGAEVADSKAKACLN